MGSGKTTAARAAAEALKAQAIDVDAELERTFGRSIERVFDEEGEQVFRAREEELTLESLARPNAPVVALGGGATGSARVREALAGGDRRVVWMDVAPDVAWQRAHGAGRPLARDGRSFEQLYADREPV